MSLRQFIQELNGNRAEGERKIHETSLEIVCLSVALTLLTIWMVLFGPRSAIFRG